MAAATHRHHPPASGAQERSATPAAVRPVLLPAIGAAVAKRRATTAGPGSFDVDDDLFEVVNRLGTANDDDARPWPTLPVAPADAPPAPTPFERNRIKQLEDTVAKLRAELSARCTQIADMCCTQQQQTDALVEACDAIQRLEQSLTTLQQRATQSDEEAAALRESLRQSNEENAVLRRELDSAKESCGLLMQNALARTGAATAAQASATAALAQVERLETALAAATSENARLTGLIDDIKTRYRAAAESQCAALGRQVEDLTAALDQRGAAIARAEELMLKLIARHTEVSQSQHALAAGYAAMQDTLKTQANTIVFLETMLRVEGKDPKQDSA